MLEVRRQKGETNQALIYRFMRAMQKSGILLRKRESRFRQRPKSEEAKKRAALRRMNLKKEKEKLKKGRGV